MSGAVRVIDIGSNSIKSLVAERRHGELIALWEGIRETRISKGISGTRPCLTDDAMTAGVAAICGLLDESAHIPVSTTRIVATSAVRDATNAEDFRTLVRNATGIELEVLSGTYEAAMIARGVATESGLPRQLTILDLGGGSLECIDADDGELQTVASFQLGAVRMMESFHQDHTRPFAFSDRQRLADHVMAVLAADVPSLKNQRPQCVGCGGAFAVIRSILMHRDGNNASTATNDGVIAACTIESLSDEIAALPLEARLRLPGLPHSRADIFPAALTVLTAASRFLGTHSFRHSLRNLRFGIADQLLPM
jgi:exopolyphosphatase/guanosine-5'-triphosphate,3'-diphosphate pyrophosphatase